MPAKKSFRRTTNQALQQQNRELQRLLGKKTMENEILHEALEVAQETVDLARAILSAGSGRDVRTVVHALRVSRSALMAKPKSGRRGRPLLVDDALLHEIRQIVAEQGSYGYRRTWAILRRERRKHGLPVPNHKRVYRIMKAHELLLERSTGAPSDRRHDGKIAVAQSDLR